MQSTPIQVSTNGDFLQDIDACLIQHFKDVRSSNFAALVEALHSLPEDVWSLMRSMAQFAYITAGYDLDNPLPGTLISRYRSSLVGMKRMESTLFWQLVGLAPPADLGEPKSDELSLILEKATSDQVVLLCAAMDYAYFVGSPDKEGWDFFD